MFGSTTAPLWTGGRARQAAVVASLSAALLVTALPTVAAMAQSPFLSFQNQLRPTVPKRPPEANKKQGAMLVQANEINYDYNNERVAAVGNVQIYYNGATIEADRVVYDQKTKRLRAEGNARLTEPDGKVTYGEVIDLSDDYRNGFIDSLRLETADQTRLAAASASRTAGNYTVFQNGVYTACEACKEDPKKPPLWQVKAARIIHNQAEKMLYFEDAKIEFYGVPLAYFPYLSTPDPTVKRKTGFLMPVFSTSTTYGFGVETPYYLALAPSYDITLSPRITTQQGVLMQAEWRQRLEDGYYSIRASGIDQLDPGAFVRSDGTTLPGDRTLRGNIETTGRFNLTPNWTWGWDAVAVSDTAFYQDYKIRSLVVGSADPTVTSLSNPTDATSQLFLTGRGERSYFDARSLYYQGFSEADVQAQIPVVLPVIDYSNVLGTPVFGGQLSYKTNLTSLTRQQADFEAISAAAAANGTCATADTAKSATDCLLRGVPGDYTRFTAEATWKRQFVDGFGQVFTPFASVRGDVAHVSVNGSDPSVANYITPGDSDVTRFMPTIGFEYRYPFISVQSWGTQTIEPIAQVIARPNEPNIGKLPNEDSQSLVFDDTNLFKVDKFAGYDRVEGGGRANVGVQYTAQFNHGGAFNVLFGQSYQLFGTNSFAVGDVSNTGLGSGLDKTASDYVARVAYSPNSIYSFTSRFRFDQADFTLHRLELEARANFDRWSYSLMYGNYDAQPELGFLTRRQGVLSTTSVKVSQNWVVSGGARYDIEAGKFDQTRVGVGYIDDCFIFGLNYITDFTYSNNVQANHTVMLQMSLRTIGGSSR